MLQRVYKMENIVHNATSEFKNALSSAEQSVEILVYCVLIGIVVCIVMYVYRIFVCAKWCCGLCCKQNPRYEEV